MSTFHPSLIIVLLEILQLFFKTVVPWLELSRQDLTDGDLWQGRQAVGTVSVCEGGVMGGARDSLYLNGVTGSLELQNYF